MTEKLQKVAREPIEKGAQGHLRRVLDSRATSRQHEAHEAAAREEDPEAPSPNSLPKRS